MTGFIDDLRFGARLLLKSPGFAVAAAVILAVAIGANTAVFSLVETVLLRPLPFPHSERLMKANLLNPATHEIDRMFGDADFVAWRTQQHAFEHVAVVGFDTNSFAFVSARGAAERVNGMGVSSGFFQALGVTAERGRVFGSEDDKAAAPAVVVSHAFWQSHLDADPSIVGRTILIGGRAQTVLGIVPTSLRFLRSEPVDVYELRTFRTPAGRPPYYLFPFGRLKPGVTREQAEAELSSIVAGVQQQFGGAAFSAGKLEPLRDSVVRDAGRLLWVLLGAVACVLLIGVVNVANLLLARVTGREREIAIRTALGASRARVVRQLLTESVLLASIGGALGVLLAWWAVRAVAGVQAVNIPRLGEISVDSTVLVFNTAITLLAGVLFGIAPAFEIHRQALNDTLKHNARTASGRRGRLRGVLVASECALALMLMVGAVLLIRSFIQLENVNAGFAPANILTADVALPGPAYPEEADVVRFWDELLRRLNAIPGVESAAVTLSLPPNQLLLTNPFTLRGQPYDASRPQQQAEEMTISPDYFRTLGVPLIAGRYFNDMDGARSVVQTAGPQAPRGNERQNVQRVIIINRSMAEKYFHGQDAVGQTIQTGDPDPRSPWETIVGVVGDVKYSGLDSQGNPQIYVPYSAPGWTSFSRTMHLVIKTRNNPLGLLPAVRDQVASLDRNLPVAHVRTMDQLMAESLAAERFRTALLGGFAGFALVLACLGIYAVTAYFVGQRTREIGIRMALGATPGHVLRLVLRHTLVTCVIGLAAGTAGALALTRVLRSLLFDVSPTDPLSFAATLVLLAGVVIAASCVPALRAARTDPLVALRIE